ncbi:MAG TPA: hypothetical protein VH682_06205 [Gemmataceae bacterium]|jgi:hypothetical protein
MAIPAPVEVARFLDVVATGSNGDLFTLLNDGLWNPLPPPPLSGGGGGDGRGGGGGGGGRGAA